jgi:hypothetical protein
MYTIFRENDASFKNQLLTFLNLLNHDRFKFHCNILISGKIIKELPGFVSSGTPRSGFNPAWMQMVVTSSSGVPRNIFRGGGSTNSVDRGQREQGSGGGSPLVGGSAQFANG